MKDLRRITLIAALALLIYATVSLVKVSSELRDATELCAELKAQIAGIEDENSVLVQDIKTAHTGKSIENAARHKLGLVKGNERIFLFN